MSKDRILSHVKSKHKTLYEKFEGKTDEKKLESYFKIKAKIRSNP